MLDRLIIVGSLLGGFIRLGNLMNSEIVGIPTQKPWAFVFASIDLVPRHPAQLYEALFYFTIALILLAILKTFKVTTYNNRQFSSPRLNYIIIKKRFAPRF